MVRSRARIGLLAVFLAACSEAAVTPSSAPASGGESAAASTAGAATPNPCGAAQASPGEEADVVTITWCIPQEAGEMKVISFSVAADSGWEREGSGSETMFLTAPDDHFLAFTLAGPDTVEGWIVDSMGREEYVVSEPAPVEIDGAGGELVDVRLAPGASENEAPLFDDPGLGGWIVENGSPTRLWVVDRSGETIAIVTDAPEQEFEAWAAAVDGVLATLVWGG